MMTVYHGGYQPVEKPEIRVNKHTKDFGSGFYCTVIREQAERWARRFNTKMSAVQNLTLDYDSVLTPNTQNTNNY